MEHFYISLPSNSSKQYYGVQSMSNYKTKLVKEIRLDVAQWQVGLAELIYPVSWNNIMNGIFNIRRLIDGKWQWIECRVPDNQYGSVEELLNSIKETILQQMGDQSKHIAFSYMQTRHVKIFLHDGYGLQLSAVLSKALGFGDNCITQQSVTNNARYHAYMTTIGNPDEIAEKCDYVVKNNSILSPLVGDVNRGLRSIFVHCNIIESQLVGDQYVPLLRTIAVRGKTDEVIAESFANIHYMRIERSSFQEIEIHLTDETGQNIPFQHGRVIVLLHFKRI